MIDFSSPLWIVFAGFGALFFFAIVLFITDYILAALVRFIRHLIKKSEKKEAQSHEK